MESYNKFKKQLDEIEKKLTISLAKIQFRCEQIDYGIDCNEKNELKQNEED